MSARTFRRVLPAALLAGGLVLAAPLAADAHVRVTPDQATPGDYATLSFKVPTESATASTVKLEVDLPTDTPFSSVSYQPVAGWTAKITTTKLDKPVKTAAGATITEAPTKIVWTADKSAEIAPGQFQVFSISAGAVPDTGSIEMPAIQTYSDGSVVKWDEATPATGDEPEHPAPTLYITDPLPAADAPASTPTVSVSPTTPATTPAPGSTSGAIVAVRTTQADDGHDGLAIGLGVGGLVLGAAGLVTGIVAMRRSRA